MASPRVTIGMPVYNGERFLEKAIRSILGQTFGDFELLVSDNASTDRTVEIVRDHAVRDSRISLHVNSMNAGAAPNYNALVPRARGEFFKWAAHDDVLAPAYLERCVHALDGDPAAVLAYPTTVMIDADDRPTGADPWDRVSVRAASPAERFRSFLLAAWPQLGCNAVFGLIRTAALRRTRLVGAYASSDKILLAELTLLGTYLHLPDPLFLRREHPGSSVRANPGVTERNQWFTTAGGGPSGFIRWHWVAELLRGVRHVPLPPVERLHAALMVRHHLSNDRRLLIAELKRPLRSALIRRGLWHPRHS
jgi:glycosyltransferase involved in cell wall biosynthesis